MRARALFLAFGLAAMNAAAATRPVALDDFSRVEEVRDPRVSPDGEWILYTVTVTDPAADRSRTDIWKVGAVACTKYCGYGSGWGTFPDVYAATQASVPGANVLVGQGAYEAHNLWLLIGVELGTPGLLLFTTGLGVAVAEALRIPRDLRGPPLSALVGLCVGVFFLSSMEFKFFWMVLIVIALNRNVVAAEEPKQHPAASAMDRQFSGPRGVPSAELDNR